MDRSSNMVSGWAVLTAGLFVGVLGAARPQPDAPALVSVRLSEWKVELSQQTIAAGAVRFAVTNAGRIPHGFEAEGTGLEEEIKPIQPAASDTAWDKGAARDSVEGVAEFATQDGARWKLVLDRVQTKDVPHHPRFGGVILGLYYHGATQVHTPLVPTINSAVALWAVGHLYKNDALVTDNAMVHVMLLSRTRRDGDFALACWDCSKNKIEELQLQLLPGPGEPRFDSPGGVLVRNGEKSSSAKPAS